MVWVDPPENCWRHWRKMPEARQEFKVPDHQRAQWVLRCLCAMYGFVDAPLMFQLALLCFLISETGALKSVWDDNFLYWVHGGQQVLAMTAHVDDLQVTGRRSWRLWTR
eukprot:6856039-Lingulodinium_polyedra.AAC.1